MLTHALASSGAGHVHGNVAPADHDDLLADRELVPKVHIEQEIDAFVNAIEIYAGNGQIATAMRSYGNQNGVESLPAQLGDGEVSSRCMIQFEGDVAGFQDLPNLRLHDIAGQAVFGNSEVEHAASDRRRLEDGH